MWVGNVIQSCSSKSCPFNNYYQSLRNLQALVTISISTYNVYIIPLLHAGRRSTSSTSTNEIRQVWFWKSHCSDFLKAFHCTGNKFIVHRGSSIMATGQPNTQPCCCCSFMEVQLLHDNVAFPSLWHAKCGNFRKLSSSWDVWPWNRNDGEAVKPASKARPFNQRRERAGSR